jgi:hypothetical protein
MENINIDTDTNGHTYYNVSKEVTLYRGDTDIYTNNGFFPNTPTFFGLKRSNVKHYGIVFTFKPIKTLKLLALDQPNQSFYDKSPSDIQNILDNQYGFKTGLRDTDRELDYKIVEHICSLGMDGYMINEMNVAQGAIVPPDDEDESDEETPRKFHSEIALCHPNDSVKLLNMKEDLKKYKPQKLESEVLRKKSLKIKHQEEQKRNMAKDKKRPRNEHTLNSHLTVPSMSYQASSSKMNSPSQTGFTGSLIGNMMMEEDDEEEEMDEEKEFHDSPTKKLKFGGYKKLSKKKGKKTRRMKKKKSTKKRRTKKKLSRNRKRTKHRKK